MKQKLHKRNLLAAIVAMLFAMIALPTQTLAQETTYDVVLEDAGSSNVNVIKAVREITGLGLADSKALVDSAPCIVLENAAEAEAQTACKKLTDAGATAKVYPTGTWPPAEEYDLKIAGKPVTSANCGDLSVIPGVSGTVKYDNATKTLTLDNAAITTFDTAINSDIGGLVVNVTGVNNIRANNTGVFSSAPMTIKGDGTLEAESGTTAAFYSYKTSMTIEGCTVIAKGATKGITGKGGNGGEDLTIRNATVKAVGSKGSICGLATVTLEDCGIVQPEGAAFDASLNGVALGGALVTDTVVIEPPVDEYALRIAGKYVTSANCGDLSVIPGVSGTAKYDNATKTLTLDNATITVTSGPGISNSISGLVVNVTGVNSVSSDYVGVFSDAPMTIKGDGTLEAKSGTSAAVYSYLTSLLIEECTVIAKGEYGIVGKDGLTGESLTIRNASVTAVGSKGSIRDFGSVTLEGCGIVQPEGAAFDASLKGVALGGALVTDTVVIEPSVDEYALRIAGKNVTSANCGDLSVIPGVSGTATYDNATKTLTLDNAAITVTSGPGIYNSISGLVINVTGTNSVSSENTGVISHKPMTIKGGGTLVAKSDNTAAIYSYETSLQIEECTVIAKGAYGITGKAGLTGEDLTIRKASVTATGSSGSISDFASVTLEDCGIVQPEGAAFDASLKGVALGGALVKDKVVIEPTEYDFYDAVLEDVGSSKLDVIKAVREITGLGLADAKALVDSAPCIVLEKVTKADAQTACDKLTAVGAIANIYPTGTCDGIAKVGSDGKLPGKRGIYTLQGVKMDSNWHDGKLPKGIYIVDGVKKIKK